MHEHDFPYWEIPDSKISPELAQRSASLFAEDLQRIRLDLLSVMRPGMSPLEVDELSTEPVLDIRYAVEDHEFADLGIGKAAFSYMYFPQISWADNLRRRIGFVTPDALLISMHMDKPTRTQVETLRRRLGWNERFNCTTEYFFTRTGQFAKISTFPRDLVLDNRVDLENQRSRKFVLSTMDSEDFELVARTLFFLKDPLAQMKRDQS